MTEIDEDTCWMLDKLKREMDEALADEEDAASRASTARQEIEDMGFDPDDLP